MKINEILVETQDLNEGPLGDFGRGVGKVAGGVAKGVGAVAGGVAGLGRAFKKGFQSGKATVAGDPDPNATATGTADPDSTKAADINATGPAGTAAAQQQTGAAGAALQKTAQAMQGMKADKAGQALYTTVKSQIDQIDPNSKKKLATLIQKSLQQPAASAQPAAPAAGDDAASGGNNANDLAKAAPASGPGSATAGTTASGQPKTEPDLNAPATGSGSAAPAAAKPAAPGAKPAAPANKAANDTFEKAKGDIRNVQSGTKPLPDQMAQGVQADIAKMAKGDKESGVAAAQKIMGFAQRGMDIAALQQAWTANAKAGERFLSQSVYRSITNMLREHGLIWSDLNLRVRIDESVGSGVFIRYAKPVVESVQLFRIK